MYDVLTLNLAFEVFGLLFCLICILISLLSPKQQASEYEITGSIQAMFICTAVILSSDSLSALFQGSDSLQAALIVRVCTFVMFLASFMMAGLMTGYITRLLPSTKGKYVRYAVGE